MIKRLIEYLTIERRTEYIQYESSSKSSSVRNYINYSTLKAISIKVSTIFTHALQLYIICDNLMFIFRC